MKAQSLSLSQLNLKLKTAISDSFADPLWVVAEISELRVNNSGHCYMELIEKAGDSDQMIAKIKATIWSFTFRMISPYFETTTGYRLDAGLKVLLKVQPEFHEVYGISLIVKDIDPSYTLGDLARKKLEILRKLKAEGVIDMNRMLNLPAVPQRIAVISSETAAGYGDFMDSLINNPQEYYFRTELFSAQVQGEKAAETIISALDRIYEKENEFDVVVIIRGGGSQSDLECFNNYDLVYHITQFPLPVISGIGHERDETITDIVAHTSVKTPTAVAEFLIDALIEFDDLLENYAEELANMAGEKIAGEKEKIFNLSQNTVYLVHQKLNEENSYLITSFKRTELFSKQFKERKSDVLGNYSFRLGFDCNREIKSENTKLDLTAARIGRSLTNLLKSKNEQVFTFEQNLEYLRPEKVLMRGYSISSSGGRLVKNADDLKEGDELVTRFYKGIAQSTIKKTKKT
jgi:exodeoxyribonuclease VII large subunit